MCGMAALPFIGYHHVLMIFLAIGILISSIMLAGCTNSLSNVYLLSISYVNTTSPTKTDPAQVNPNISTTFEDLAGTSNGTVLEVRVGYLGLCISQNIGTWICASSATALASLVKAASESAGRSTFGGGDPLNLIWIASSFRNEIVFDGLIFTSIPLAFLTMVLLFTFPGWHSEIDDDGSERDVKPFPSRLVSSFALGLIAVSSILMLVSLLWQHVASSAAATMVHGLSYGTIKSHVGPVTMVLGWTTVLLFAVVTAGLLIMVLSIRVLSALTS